MRFQFGTTARPYDIGMENVVGNFQIVRQTIQQRVRLELGAQQMLSGVAAKLRALRCELR